MHVYEINKILKRYAYFLTKIYPFTDPATNPLIKKRCKEKKINKGTVMDINAPVVKINENYYEDLTLQSVEELINNLINNKKIKPGPQTSRKGSEPGKV